MSFVGNNSFIECANTYDESKIVIFGAAFDLTSSNRSGSKFAPQMIRIESQGIETYSPYQDKSLEEINVFDAGDLDLPFTNAQKSLNIIELFVLKILKDEKIPLMIGGEHLVTLGAIRGFVKKYPSLNIIHFDAHADLRDEYMGEKLSHATVMRRCFEITKKNKIFQFGIRSGEKIEFDFAKENTFLNKFNFDQLDKVLEKINEEPIYFSLDLDVLDSGEFPGTGTPEAGGVSFKELLDAILKFKNANVVGLDVVELSPFLDLSNASTALACKIIREILMII